MRESAAFSGNAAYYVAHYPMSLVSSDPAAAQSLQICVDIGSADPWHGRDESLHALLNARGVPHQWRMWAGGHDDAYWTEHLEDYLRFYGAAFTPDMLRAQH